MTDVNVDSANTTAIAYDSYGSTPWLLTKVTNNGAIFAQSLTRATSTGGAVFRFRGTSVKVFGTLTIASPPGARVDSTYTLDGGAPTPFSSTSVPGALITEVDNQLFFDSGALADGVHTLVLNVSAASVATPYLLDYIKYTSTGPQPPPAGARGADGSGRGSAGAPVGPIVGGVLGGLVVVALAVFLYMRYFQHRIKLGGRQRGDKKDLASELEGDEPKSDTVMSASVPFLSHPPDTPYAPSSTVGPDDSASQVAGRLYAAELGLHILQAPGSHSSSRGSPAVGESNRTRSEGGSSPSYASGRTQDRKQGGPPPVPVVEETVQHQDSGIRFRDGELPLIPPALPADELPPGYS